jgi:hypothetical protein
MVNTAILHTLVNQSSILVSTLTNLIRQVADGILEQQSSPAYFPVGPSVSNNNGKGVREEVQVLQKIPPPIPPVQQHASGPPFSNPHPMSGFPRRPPPPTSILHAKGHNQQMPIPSDQGYRHTVVSDPRQHYAPDALDAYFKIAGYQFEVGNNGPLKGFHMALDYIDYQGL